eukprot:TRINITY_DN9109_c0_g1_i12.p1 TRINITY_DN9109_c0_g1~~TRINITY_DN9109_c0_g1_i12.p1  ORF type:complete len:105 (+),score=3.96 TRINITY_DN9109_c0_g1_i12:643-957(+)
MDNQSIEQPGWAMVSGWVLVFLGSQFCFPLPHTRAAVIFDLYIAAALSNDLSYFPLAFGGFCPRVCSDHIREALASAFGLLGLMFSSHVSFPRTFPESSLTSSH